MSFHNSLRLHFLLTLTICGSILSSSTFSEKPPTYTEKPPMLNSQQIITKFFEVYPDIDENNDKALSPEEMQVLLKRAKEAYDGWGSVSWIYPISLDGVPATYADVSYGPGNRNVFDIWLADSEKPTPLVIAIHGGGFGAGDKSMYFDSESIPRYLKAGISFATINYRYWNTCDQGVLGSMKDAKRALQFIRTKAKKWNIDTKRIGATGGSAGATTSLWLAFHDDMAIPDHPDPVLRESTRIACAAAGGVQATYDILRWKEIISHPRPEPTEKEYNDWAIYFGFKNKEELLGPKGQAYRKELDTLDMMSLDDPPFYVRNNAVPSLDNVGHHPAHAVALKKKAEKIGLKGVLIAKEIGLFPPDEDNIDASEFLIRELSR
jgi:BD-FAE